MFLTPILFISLCRYLAGLYGSNVPVLCFGVSGLSLSWAASICMPWDTDYPYSFWQSCLNWELHVQCEWNPPHSNICFYELNYLCISWSFCFIGYCFYNILYILSTKCIKETYNGEAICVGVFVLCHLWYTWLDLFEIRCHIRNCEISLWLMSGNDKAYCACSSDESLWMCFKQSILHKIALHIICTLVNKLFTFFE